MVKDILTEAAKILNVQPERLTYVLSNSGVGRAAETYKNVLLIYVDGEPGAVAKWCDDASLLEGEAAALTELAIAGVAAPKFLSMGMVGSKAVLFEEFLPGDSLQALLNRKLLSQDEALRLAATAFENLLSKTRKLSDINSLKLELAELLLPLSSGQILGTAGVELAHALEKELLEHFAADRAVDSSLVHFDFRLSNIIASDKLPFLFDFEFAQRSHFAACDWLRLFSYSPGVEAGALLRTECPAALRKAVEQPKLMAKLQALAYLCDYKIKKRVLPAHTAATIDADLRAQLGGQLDESQRPLSLQIKTEKMSIASEEDDIAELKQHLLTLEVALHGARQERNETLQELGIAQHRLNRTQETLRVRDSELSHRDHVINAITNCASFKIGKAVTGIFKLIPGVKSRAKSQSIPQ